MQSGWSTPTDAREPSTTKKRCTRIACVARSQPHPVGGYPPWRPPARRLATRRRGCSRVADPADEARGRWTRPPEKPLLTASFRRKISAGLSGPKSPQTGSSGAGSRGSRQTRDFRERSPTLPGSRRCLRRLERGVRRIEAEIGRLPLPGFSAQCLPCGRGRAVPACHRETCTRPAGPGSGCDHASAPPRARRRLCNVACIAIMR